MFLALREMRRAKARFGLLTAAIALLLFLILTQQAIQNGLITAFVGAIERQSAPVLVYSTDGQRTLQGSVIAPSLERRIRAVPGVAAAGRIGQSTFTVRVGSGGDSDAAIIGYDRADLGAPDELSAGRLPRAAGEAVGSAADFSLDDRVRVQAAGGPGGAGRTLRVVGLARDAQLQVTPTLFVAWPDYVAAVKAANPDVTTVLPSALGVRPAPGVSAAALARRVNDASEDADALTRAEAARSRPASRRCASPSRSSSCSTGWWPRSSPACSSSSSPSRSPRRSRCCARSGRAQPCSCGSLLVQVVLVMAGGLALGVALYTPLSQMTLGSITLRFDAGAVVFWSVLLLALGLLSAVVAARRVLHIDPIEATTGGGAR